jgi:hypothetical protein
MSINNRLINTGGVASTPYSLENAVLINTYTATVGALNYNQMMYTSPNNVIAINNSGQAYQYSFSGSTLTYRGFRQNPNASTFGKMLFIKRPTVGYLYIPSSDANQPSQTKIDRINLNTSGTYTGSGSFSISESLIVNTSGDRVFSFDFNEDGTILYVSDAFQYKIYSLSTPYSLSTATLQTSGINFDDEYFLFALNGTRLFIKTGAAVIQYDLTTAYDVTTRTNEFVFSAGVYGVGVSFNEGGTRMYVGQWGTLSEFAL